jgi:recombinational DNA repair ATPase RecF
LDEVMAELDLQRRADLLRYSEEHEQVLFTATDARMFTPEFMQKVEVWKVEEGTIHKG